eukprot:8688972-Alexandrium_andersonii.AAC.1
MSASLVGSEMCIRDRLAMPSISLPLAAALWGAYEGRPTAPATGQPDAAVSYTHLTLPTICSV